jgi:hypothetical protein
VPAKKANPRTIRAIVFCFFINNSAKFTASNYKTAWEIIQLSFTGHVASIGTPMVSYHFGDRGMPAGAIFHLVVRIEPGFVPPSISQGPQAIIFLFIDPTRSVERRDGRKVEKK